MYALPLTPPVAARLLTLAVLRVYGGTGSGNFAHAGRPGTVGGSSAESTHQQQLAAVQTNPLAHPSIVAGMEWNVRQEPFKQYIAAYGEQFTSDGMLPADVKAGEPNQCYRNASLLVMERPDLTYAEGFFEDKKIPGLAIWHAWAVSADGKVIDPTLGGQPAAKDGTYFGVKYDRAAYLKYLYTAKIYGVIGSTQANAERAVRDGGRSLRGITALGGPGSGNFGHAGGKGGKGNPGGLTRGDVTAVEFNTIALKQRGAPQRAMLHAQHLMGDSAMDPVIERMGDLVHDMTDRSTFDTAGYNAVKDKVDRLDVSLADPYEFDRKYNEDIHNNAFLHQEAPSLYRARVEHALDAYADAHATLPIYNEAQQFARDGAIALGRREWDEARWNVQQLKDHLKTKEEWVAYAHQGITQRSVPPYHPPTLSQELFNPLGHLGVTTLDAVQSNWQHLREGLVRRFTFADRRNLASFLAALCNDANAANHHPDIATYGDTATVTYCTHSEGDTVTDLDRQAAERADRIAATYEATVSA